MKIQTAKLTGPALHYLVGMILVEQGLLTDDPERGDLPNKTGTPPFFVLKGGRPMVFSPGKVQVGTHNQATGKPWVFHGPGGMWEPSTDAGQGAPILFREEIALEPVYQKDTLQCWWARRPLSMRWSDVDGEYIDGSDGYNEGETALLAGLRCLVAVYRGAQVDVPEELVTEDML